MQLNADETCGARTIVLTSKYFLLELNLVCWVDFIRVMIRAAARDRS